MRQTGQNEKDAEPPPTAPDLTVSASVDDSSLETGAGFTLSATVENEGDGYAQLVHAAVCTPSPA